VVGGSIGFKDDVAANLMNPPITSYDRERRLVEHHSHRGAASCAGENLVTHKVQANSFGLRLIEKVAGYSLLYI
jgi:hypothetical protein